MQSFAHNTLSPVPPPFAFDVNHPSLPFSWWQSPFFPSWQQSIAVVGSPPVLAALQVIVHPSWWQSPMWQQSRWQSPLLSFSWQYFIPVFCPSQQGILSQSPVPPNRVPYPTHFHDGVAAVYPLLSCQQSTSLRNSFKRNVTQHTIDFSLCSGWNSHFQRFSSG